MASGAPHDLLPEGARDSASHESCLLHLSPGSLTPHKLACRALLQSSHMHLSVVIYALQDSADHESCLLHPPQETWHLRNTLQGAAAVLIGASVSGGL